MALNNHKKGQPWTTQYPRRADGGWKDGNNVRSQLYSASIALDSALYNAVDGYDPCDLHDRIQEAMSRLQEADDMLADRYRFDRDTAKAAYIKANKDSFIEPAAFLEPESEE